MRMDRLTTKSQEALRAAVDMRRGGATPSFPEHLLVAVLDRRRHRRPLVEKAGGNPKRLVADLTQTIESCRR